MVQVGIDLSIPRNEYQVKPHSSPWFSADCAAAMAHRNHIVVAPTINVLPLNWSIDKLVTIAKGFLKLPNLILVIKQKLLSLFRNLAHATSGKLQIVCSTEVSLLYFIDIMALRSCLLHVIQQNCLMKTFPRFLFLMTRTSLYLLSLLDLI